MKSYEKNTSVFRDFIKDYSFVLLLQGNYKDHPGYDIAHLVEYNLKLYYPKGITKRLTYLVIEAIQNIERYSLHNESSLDHAIIYVNKCECGIITQNTIKNKDVEALQARLSELENKHVDELRNMYMDAMSNSEGTEKGAGLGLIDIARKTQHPLKHSFKKISDEFSTYSLQIKYAISDEHTCDESVNERLLHHLEDQYAGLPGGLLYFGSFSNEFLSTLLNVLKNFNNDSPVIEHAIIELVQNIKRHGHRRDDDIRGYVALKTTGNEFTIDTCNELDQPKLDITVEYIDSINALSNDELNLKCLEVLQDESNPGGLGLINVAQYTRPRNIEAFKYEDDGDSNYIYIRTKFDNQ